MQEVYQHGIRVNEKPTQYEKPSNSQNSIQIVVGTAPVNMAANPEEAANTVILCRDFYEAKEKLGYSTDFRHYTLCQSMYASFLVQKVAPVIFINVLDPAKHKKENQAETLQVVNRQAVLPLQGVLLQSVKVMDGENVLVPDKDYILSFEDSGEVNISFTSDISSVTVSSTSIDPELVTYEDVIGGYDAATGKETGMELLRRVFHVCGFFAAPILVIPDFSRKKEVATMMELKCQEINGKYKATPVIDLPAPADSQYTDCEEAKKELGVCLNETHLLYPMVKKDGYILSYSSLYAALMCAIDLANDDIPSLYYSNKELAVDAIVLEDGSEVLLDESEANTLNAAGIITAIKTDNFRTWGNRTACYPQNQDIKDSYSAIRRFFLFNNNRFQHTYMDFVDQNFDFRVVDAIVLNENLYCTGLVATGKCAAMSIEIDTEKTTQDEIVSGHFFTKRKLAAYTPLEYIEDTMEYDVNALMEEFSSMWEGDDE